MRYFTNVVTRMKACTFYLTVLQEENLLYGLMVRYLLDASFFNAYMWYECELHLRFLLTLNVLKSYF